MEKNSRFIGEVFAAMFNGNKEELNKKVDRLNELEKEVEMNSEEGERWSESIKSLNKMVKDVLRGADKNKKNDKIKFISYRSQPIYNLKWNRGNAIG